MTGSKVEGGPSNSFRGPLGPVLRPDDGPRSARASGGRPVAGLGVQLVDLVFPVGFSPVVPHVLPHSLIVELNGDPVRVRSETLRVQRLGILDEVGEEFLGMTKQTWLLSP